MVHTNDLKTLMQTVEDFKWYKEQATKCEAIFNELCTFNAEDNGHCISDKIFYAIASAFNGQKQLSISVTPCFSFSLFPLADSSILMIIEEDGKIYNPLYAWSIEDFVSKLALNGYLRYFDNISEEDFIASILIESLN